MLRSRTSANNKQVLDCVVSTGRCLHPLLHGTSAVINQPKSLAEGVVMPVENRYTGLSVGPVATLESSKGSWEAATPW